MKIMQFVHVNFTTYMYMYIDVYCTIFLQGIAIAIHGTGVHACHVLVHSNRQRLPVKFKVLTVIYLYVCHSTLNSFIELLAAQQ